MSFGTRTYIVPIENVSIGTAVQDIFSLKSSATVGLAIHWIHLESTNTSAATLRMRLKRATATLTQGSGGSTPTPVPLSQLDTAAATTAHINDTSQTTTSGAFTTLAGFQWDTVLPWDFLPPPEDRPICAAGGAGLLLDLPATITATTISGFIVFAEAP